jgi:hypothetical protein
MSLPANQQQQQPKPETSPQTVDVPEVYDDTPQAYTQRRDAWLESVSQ